MSIYKEKCSIEGPLWTLLGSWMLPKTSFFEFLRKFYRESNIIILIFEKRGPFRPSSMDLNLEVSNSLITLEVLPDMSDRFLFPFSVSHLKYNHYWSRFRLALYDDKLWKYILTDEHQYRLLERIFLRNALKIKNW